MSSLKAVLKKAIWSCLAGGMVVLVGVGAPIGAGKGQVRQVIADGAIVDWTAFEITARGFALYSEVTGDDPPGPAAVDSARNRAFRQLWKTLQQLPLDGHSRLVDRFALNPSLQQACYRLARRFTITDVHIRRRSGVEVEIKLSLTGSLLKTLLPPWPQQKRWLELLGTCPVCKTPWEVPTSERGQAIAPTEEPFTSIVLLAGESALAPALNARIISEHGMEVYSEAFLSPELRGKVPVLRYLSVHNKKDRLMSWIGERPLVIRIQRVAGRWQTMPVISEADARKMHGDGAHHDLMRQGRVFVILKRIAQR